MSENCPSRTYLEERRSSLLRCMGSRTLSSARYCAGDVHGEHRSRVGSVRPFGSGTLDEWAMLWHPDIRVTVPEEQPEFLPTN
jgi:hypothetical protein